MHLETCDRSHIGCIYIGADVRRQMHILSSNQFKPLVYIRFISVNLSNYIDHMWHLIYLYRWTVHVRSKGFKLLSTGGIKWVQQPACTVLHYWIICRIHVHSGVFFAGYFFYHGDTQKVHPEASVCLYKWCNIVSYRGFRPATVKSAHTCVYIYIHTHNVPYIAYI